jgi:hypothetical protein
MGDYGSQAAEIVNAIGIAIANWSTAMAIVSVRWLIGSLGSSTEPDLSAIVPVYDRMLAISLLVLGAIVALALIERIAWSSQGSGLALIPRVVGACFFADAGLGAVKYVAGYAALLATAWTPDFTKMTDLLLHSVAVSDYVNQSGGSGSHVSVAGLIVTALCLCFLTVVVHLELVVRSALILTVTSFIPLVCVISIWPRLAGAATQLASFLIGLLLSKFVVATAVYVGFRLVVLALVSPTDTDATENWMASGVAVLLIAAVSPLVIFQAVRIGHASAGQVARGWVGGAVAFAPPTRFLGGASRLGQRFARNIGTRALSAAQSLRKSSE